MSDYQLDEIICNLYNLVSGQPAPDNVCESLLQCEYTGKQRMEESEDGMTGDAPTGIFFDPIPRVAIKTFKGPSCCPF